MSTDKHPADLPISVRRFWPGLLLILVLVVLLFLSDRERESDRQYRHQAETTAAYRESARLWAEAHQPEVARAWVEAVLRPSTRNPQHVVRKWTHEVRVELRGDHAAEHRPWVGEWIASVAPLLDPLPIRWAESGEEPDLIIYLTSGLSFFQETGRGGGNRYQSVDHHPDGSFRQARFQIHPPAHSREELEREFGRFFLISLGLSPTPPPGQPSLFQAEAHEREFTDWDRQALRMLYDPRLPPGILTRDILFALDSL